MDIRLIQQEEIDKVKWNSCIHYATNGNIFGYKWFLDNVAKDWDALVEGDYESVFPLIWKNQKHGFWRKEQKVLHQPELIRTAGLYSIHVPSQKRIRSFLEKIPPGFDQQEIRLAEGTKIPEDLGYQQKGFKNFLLLLQEPYEQISAGYHPQLQQQLERSSLANLLPQSNLKPEKLAEFYLQEAPGDPKVKEKTAHALQRIMYNALFRGWGFISGINSPQGELLAINFFMISHKRVMSLMPVESQAGAKVGALAFLFDLVVRTQAGKPMLLDFNIGEDDLLAQHFGATEIPYLGIYK